MKIGLIVTTYNRSEYLKQCLESLSSADMPEGTRIVIVDDCSDDKKVYELVIDFAKNKIVPEFFQKMERRGIKDSIKKGCEILIDDGFSLIINIDGDALVRNDFITELVKLHERFPDHLITGFECTNKNDDGTPRHKIESEGDGYKVRKTVGGINLCFTPKMYHDWILPALQEEFGNWDQKACLNAGNGVICASPSLIQHIGLESSMGHSGEGRMMADISHTFKPLGLTNVTLIGVDSNRERLQAAFDESTRDIHFGAVTLINAHLTSKEAYSRYCIKELYKHVETSHLLIVQYDGYVKNWKSWDNSWLQYDYIGAPWEWYTDGMQVGNGGFSLRSRKLMEIVATDPAFDRAYHPEDHVICRVYRKYLEEKHGIKFAPVEVARKFSIEGFQHWDKLHSGQFGFHGSMVKFSEHPAAGQTLFIQQFFGLGDVIFCIQLVRNLMEKGYKALWPVMAEFVAPLKKAYPDIDFIDVNLTNPNLWTNIPGNKMDKTVNGTRFLPIRWTYEIMKVGMDRCMTSKYDFLHMDWEKWKNATFVRDVIKEQELFDKLGLKDGEPYTLVNKMFGTQPIRTAQMPNFNGPVVEMKVMEGFSLFDWCKVIENASEIHTVSTSIVYLFELLELKCEPHIYIRKPIERDHSNYQHIMTKHKYHFEP